MTVGPRRTGLLIALTALLAATVAVVAGCERPTATVSATPLPPMGSDVRVAVPVHERGIVVSDSTITDLDDDVRAVASMATRATYTSTSGVTGTETTVTGSFFVPKGPVPEGGWPVISFGHGTTGSLRGCGLSSSANLQGYAPVVKEFLRSRYAVAVADYEGLGGPGEHPYLVADGEAFNVIDAVRALRRLTPGVSARWAGYGESQGGQAVWAANELASTYGAGLDLVGTVALSPASNVTALAELIEDDDLSPSQRVIAPLVVAGASQYDESLRADTLLPGIGRAEWDSLLGCDNHDRVRTATVLGSRAVPELSGTTAIRFTEFLQRNALPQRVLSAPMLVLNGSDDDLIRPEWIEFSVVGSCALGGTIEHHVVAGGGHANLGQEQRSAEWVAARFSGQTAPTTC